MSSLVENDVVAAADHLAIPYVPQASGWLYASERGTGWNRNPFVLD